MHPLIESSDHGLYCRAGGFYIDPWRGVERAIITHAHSDHARWGSRAYLTSASGARVLRERLGPAVHIESLPYGRPTEIGGVRVSLHPAGHLLGSAQVRLEYKGEVWVVTGDFKTQPDRTCEPFELVECQTLITESTFALPIYRWPPQAEVFAEINAWWRENQARGRTSILFAYALGKAQRVLGGVDPAVGPILVHGAVERFLPAYAAAGIALPPTKRADDLNAAEAPGRALIVAPPSAAHTPWIHKFEPYASAFASGWMLIRGERRRRALERGFVLSDHADWDDLIGTIRASGAETVLVTHGYTGPLVEWLREQGLNARAIHTTYAGQVEESFEIGP